MLGRAVRAVRTDRDRFLTLLSGNAEVAFPSRTTTIAAAAANLPASATDTATSTSKLLLFLLLLLPLLLPILLHLLLIRSARRFQNPKQGLTQKTAIALTWYVET
jgi:hypothetical protein